MYFFKASLFPFVLIKTLALLASIAGAEDNWWNKEWASRRQITIDASGIPGISTPVTAPILIKLHDANFGFTGKEDGSDIRVIGPDGKTPLPFYIERYDAFLNNQVYLWVLPDAISKASKTDIFLYYGNLKPEATATGEAKAVLDKDTLVCYHFAEQGMPVDSTENGLNGTSQPGWIEGSFIGGGSAFVAATELKLPQNPLLALPANSPLTWSAWVKLSGLSDGRILSYGPAANGIGVAVDATGLPSLSVAGQEAKGTTPLAVNAWVHLAMVADAGKVTLYADAKPVAAVAAGLPAIEGATFVVGKNESSPSFIGEMDEMQIAKVARDDSWISVAAFTQGSAGQEKFLSFAAEEVAEMSWIDGKTTGAVLVRNLTHDGWAVIIICFFMSIISWVIMYNKVRLLGAINKGNAVFMEQWKKLSRDLTSLDGCDVQSIKTMGGRISGEQQKSIQKSSVYRLYHIGSDELSHRLQAEGGADAGISARSMEAIKATMDSGLVREGQRLNKFVVLLTICISGGPFLGLLGTVIGVMITFAAIAAEGAVDVNNIAPGIAGALLATVAGLAVAIPALFGYNYILSKIKECQADMSVFIDEFVTRMAENYPDAKGSH